MMGWNFICRIKRNVSNAFVALNGEFPILFQVAVSRLPNAKEICLRSKVSILC